MSYVKFNQICQKIKMYVVSFRPINVAMKKYIKYNQYLFRRLNANRCNNYYALK